MVVSTRKITKNTLFLYVRMIMVMLISLYTVRLTLSILGVEDYGIYSAVGGVVAAFSSLSAVLSSASQRFYSIEIGRGNLEYIPIVFYSMIKVYLLVILAIFLIGCPIGYWFVGNYLNYPNERIDAVFTIYVTSFISFLIALFASPFQALIIAKEDMNIYAYLGIVEVLFKLLIVFILQSIDFDKLVLYGLLIMFIQIISCLLYIGITYKKYEEIRVIPRTDSKVYKQIFTFSGWTLFGSVANMVNIHGINILLNIFFGPIVNAAYAIANQITYAVNSFATNFFTAVKPGLMKTYASSDYDKMYKLLEMSSLVSFFLLFILILPICLEAEFILKIWLGTVGEYMVDFSVLMLIYILILSMNNPITTIVQATGRVKMYYGIIDSFILLSIPTIIFALQHNMPPWIVFIINILFLLFAHCIRIYLLYKLTGYTAKMYAVNILYPICRFSFISILGCYLFKYLLQDCSFTGLITLPIYCLIIIVTGWYSILNVNYRKKIKLMLNLKMHRK